MVPVGKLVGAVILSVTIGLPQELEGSWKLKGKLTDTRATPALVVATEVWLKDEMVTVFGSEANAMLPYEVAPGGKLQFNSFAVSEVSINPTLVGPAALK
jgi:hypothetical protein